jgi:hypothetical protein
VKFTLVDYLFLSDSSPDNGHDSLCRAYNSLRWVLVSDDPCVISCWRYPADSRPCTLLFLLRLLIPLPVGIVVRAGVQWITGSIHFIPEV